MLRTLSGRLALLLFSGLCAVVAAYGVLTYQGARAQIDEANQKLNRNLASYLVETNKLAKGDPVNQRGLSKLFAGLMSVNPNIEIYLLDDDGTILAYSAAEQRVKRKAIDLGPVREFLGGREMFPLLGDDPRDPARRKVFSVAPIAAQGRLEAYLYVVLGGEEYDSIAEMLRQSRLARTSLQIAALAIGFLAVAWFVLFWSVTRRLQRLMTRVARFQENLQVPKAPGGSGAGDEIDQLELTFTQMSVRIAQQVEALKRTDELRRELIANVSHDLRTPLTALHGYLETLLIKRHELSAARQHEFLETAMRSSQRLNKLVLALFDLAKLESHVDPPKLEAFSASDLLADIAAEFLIVAEQHGVRLQTRIDETLPPVLGNIELIERALQNLIQNAIQHTSPDGEVVIAARPDATGVAISVSDNGHGIASEDLPYIFDRYFKVPGIAVNDQGAGLGLAIAKRIMELHGVPFSARSKIAVGTTFEFILSASPLVLPVGDLDQP